MGDPVDHGRLIWGGRPPGYGLPIGRWGRFVSPRPVGGNSPVVIDERAIIVPVDDLRAVVRPTTSN